MEGDRGAGDQEKRGAGGAWEMGEEGAGSGNLKVVGSGRKREKLWNIAEYFAIEKMQRGGNQQVQGGIELRLKGTESGRFKPPVHVPPSSLVCVK